MHYKENNLSELSQCLPSLPYAKKKTGFERNIGSIIVRVLFTTFHDFKVVL